MDFIENLKIRQDNINALYNALNALIEQNKLNEQDVSNAWHWLNVDRLSVVEILDRLPR